MINDKDLKKISESTFDQKLSAIPSVDTLDFELREGIQGCSNCRNLHGYQQSRTFKKDPGMYKHVKEYRKALKKDRIRPEDLSDDPLSLVIQRVPKAE